MAAFSNAAFSNTALAVFQIGDASAHDLHLLTWFVGFIALALLVAAVVMVVLAVFAAKLLNSVHGISCEVKERVGPLLDKTHALVEELGPKISTITGHAEHISSTVRVKVDELGATVTQLNDTVQQVNSRTQVHVAHADGIVKDALNAAEQIARMVEEGVRIPVRQAVGIVAGLKAGLDTLVARFPFGRGQN